MASCVCVLCAVCANSLVDNSGSRNTLVGD